MGCGVLWAVFGLDFDIDLCYFLWLVGCGFYLLFWCRFRAFLYGGLDVFRALFLEVIKVLRSPLGILVRLLWLR